MTITITSLSKRFGGFAALDGIDLTVRDGELLALLGPSGSGKTTLLRCIAGLETGDAGSIAFAGRDVTRADPRDRKVGFVFQHYALFRHMSVLDNVSFGLTCRPRALRPPKAEIRERAMRLLSLVQLDWLADRLPHQLSGGQRQRIALARALAVEPKVLLLDEPFGALDAKVRVELRRWLRRLHDETGITSVFVTHDQEEALEVADRVVVLNHGRIEQIGTPDEVYRHPASAFVHHFLGQVNVFHGRHADAPDDVAFVRPHDILISRTADCAHPLTAEVLTVNAAGPHVRVDLRLVEDRREIEVHLPHSRQAELNLAPSDRVCLDFDRNLTRTWSRDQVKDVVDYQI